MIESKKVILPWLLLVTGSIGTVASLVLTYDAFQLLKDPGYVPVCNINPLLSCLSVMQSDQAQLFGIPNSVFGLVAFSMLVVFAVFLLSGATVHRRVWLGTQAAATLGVIFMHYLFFQAVYQLGTICPWCFVVWMVTIPTFWYITVHNIRHGIVKLPASLSRFVQRHHGDILGVWYVAIIAILLLRFGSQFMALL